jgi:hypothetical protein
MHKSFPSDFSSITTQESPQAPDGNNCLERDCSESSDLFAEQSTPSPKLLHGKTNVEDDNSTSKAVDCDKSPSKYEEGDDDDNEDNFFTSESFLEVVSGIANDLDKPQKPPAKSVSR